MKMARLLISGLILAGLCAGSARALPADADVDAILDALHARGRDLRTLTADVDLAEIDPDFGAETRRGGRVWLDQSGDPVRFRALFTDKRTESAASEERIEYALDGGALIDRNYQTRTQVRRQVLKPGERLNLLRLGEGPFPLPIGQTPTSVHEAFEAQRVDEPEMALPGHVHLRLLPREGTPLARRFSVIEVWVDLKTDLPGTIETVGPDGRPIRRTELRSLRLNVDLRADDLRPAEISTRDWNVIDEAMER